MTLVGEAGRPVRIEYMKSRRVLRIWVGDTKEEPTELALGDFCERLGIDRQIVGDRCFLLFAGRLHGPCAGPHGLMGVFQSESQAREAFMALRCAQPAEAEWGQLIAIDEQSAVRMLAWFGGSPGSPIRGESREPSSATPDPPGALE